MAELRIMGIVKRESNLHLKTKFPGQFLLSRLVGIVVFKAVYHDKLTEITQLLRKRAEIIKAPS